MIHEKIKGGIMAINSLAGQVNEGAWETLKCARAELADAAYMAEAMESSVTIEQLSEVRGGVSAQGAAHD